MTDGVDIPLDSMSALNDALKKIVIEFEDAGHNTDAVEDAIGRPLGRSELREAAHDFEGKWDDKRETLKRGLVDLQKHVEGARDGWQKLDQDLAKQLENQG